MKPKPTSNVLAESTRVAQTAAKAIGGTFEQGVGFKPTKVLAPEVSATDLATPAPPLRLPEPVTAMPPSQFVKGFEPVTKAAEDHIVRLRTDEAGMQKQLLDELTGRETTSTRDVYQQTFDDEIERMTGMPAAKAQKQLADENIKLAQLQGKFRTASEAVSGAEGQSKVFEGVQLGELSRQEAVEVGNQAILVQALQGNMSAARQTALDTAKFAYDDERAELDTLIKQYDAVTGIVDQQTQQVLDAQKAEAEARKAELERTQTAIDTAIMSGGATVAEMQQLTSLNVSGDQKQALAQSIMARTAASDRALTRANVMDQMAGRAEERAARAQAAIDAKVEEDAAESEIEMAKSEKALGMLESVRALSSHAGLNNAVGTTFMGRGFNPLNVPQELFTGSRSEFISEVDRLSNALTLENMELLKGPATDKDVEIVAASMSRLKNRDVSQSSYREELTRLEEAFQRIVTNVGITPEQAQFYFGLDESDTGYVDGLYESAGSTPSTFNPATYY